MLYGGWLSDDYFIGLRQILNLVHGRGFSFYSDARVQTMTSPLWGLVLTPVVAVTDGFYGPILFSIALSVAAIGLLFRLYWRDPSARVPFLLALAALASSKAFIDFSSSGLENPLAYLASAALFVSWQRFRHEDSGQQFAKVCAAGAMLCLTRYEYGLIALPVLLAGAWRLQRGGRALPGLAVFALAVAPWMAFSLVYYGSIFPNTFYAKLTTAIPLGDSVLFGFRYYRAMLAHDPQSLAVMALGLLSIAFGPCRRHWAPLCFGILAYVAFTVVAGGDFMIGRFVSVPVLASAALLCEGLRQLEMRRRVKLQLALAAAWLLVLPRLPLLDTYLTPEGMQRANKHPEILPRINDEKSAYLPERGLLTGHLRFADWLGEQLKQWQAPPPANAQQRVVMIDCGGLGWLSMEYGPDAHVYDLCALADPFLSKLPLYELGANRKLMAWGPGHFTRAQPEGYGESLASGWNQLTDPALAELYDAIQLVTKGAFFSLGRWKAIYSLATQEIIAKARNAPSYTGGAPAQSQETYAAPYAKYTRLFRTQCTAEVQATPLRPSDRVELSFSTVHHARELRLSGSPGQRFTLTFQKGADPVTDVEVNVNKWCDHGLGVAVVPLPPPLTESGFDFLTVSAPEQAAPAFLGGLLIPGVALDSGFADLGERVFQAPGCKLSHKGVPSTQHCSVIGQAGTPVPHLTYGPYVELGTGGYAFKLRYRSSARAGTKAGHWDVVLRADDEEFVLTRGELVGTDNEHGELRGDFWVLGKRAGGVVEIRTSPDGDVETEVLKLEIYRHR